MKSNENDGRNHTGENTTRFNNEMAARKEGLKKGALNVAVISFFVLVIAGVTAYYLYIREHTKQLAQMQTERNLFIDQLSVRDSTINDWLQTFDQIEKDLYTIKQKENLITLSSSSGVELTMDRKAQILQDIKTINSLLEDNKKKIASLNAKLNNSGSEMKSLKERLANLEVKMEERETEISALKTALVEKDSEIGQLNNLTNELQGTVAQQKERIADQAGELSKAFLATGTYKDLKEMGLVSKEGGFLGLGKTESLIGDFTDSLFSQIDINEMKTIPVNSRNAKLITEHPSDSYELVHSTDDHIAYIEIKDPNEFWKISKYAVVEVVK